MICRYASSCQFDCLQNFVVWAMQHRLVRYKICSTPTCLGRITCCSLRNFGASREKRADFATLVTACLFVLVEYSNCEVIAGFSKRKSLSSNTPPKQLTGRDRRGRVYSFTTASSKAAQRAKCDTAQASRRKTPVSIVKRQQFPCPPSRRTPSSKVEDMVPGA